MRRGGEPVPSGRCSASGAHCRCPGKGQRPVVHGRGHEDGGAQDRQQRARIIDRIFIALSCMKLIQNVYAKCRRTSARKVGHLTPDRHSQRLDGRNPR